MCSYHLGIAAYERGDFQTARDHFELQLKEAEKTGNKDAEGGAYVNLGLAYDSLGKFEKAIEFHQQGLSIAQKTGNKDAEGGAYGNLGLAYDSLGKFEKAIEFHQQDLSIAEKTGNKDSEGKTYVNLGVSYHSLGNFEKAIKCLQQGLSIAKKTKNKDTEGKAYGNLGLAYKSLGDFEKAIEFHEQDLSIVKKTGNKDSEGKAYVNLGNAYGSLDNFEKAIELYQQGLSIAKETGNKVVEAKAYANLGRKFTKHFSNYCRAEECFKSSITLLEEIRGLLHEKDEWKISFRDQYRFYKALWSLQLRRGNTIEALLTAESGRAQALVDALKLKYGVKTVKSSPEEQMNEMDILSGQTSSPTIFIAEDEDPKSLNIWLLLKSQKLQFIRKESSQTLRDLISKSYEQIGVKELVRCGGHSFGDESDDEEIEGSSDRGTNENASSQDECDALKIMYELIIAPTSQWITDDELIIVPDGSSFFIPYASLVDQHSRYLSETLRIRLAPSLTTLRLLTDCPEGHHSTSGALLVGNPWVETVRFKGDKFKQLPGAEEEVKIIGQILNIEPLIGKNATKDQVLSGLQSVSLVHIASHGHAETGEIILSPNNASSKKPEEEDFLLSMADVLNAKLNAKLVVLSSCYTGRGKIKAEGVVGIARSFLAAGARAVITSLWEISDEATLVFMKHFYEQLMEGQSASKSLNQTKKWMQKTGDFSAVKYWAPFMLIGDDVTMDFGQSR